MMIFPLLVFLCAAAFFACGVMSIREEFSEGLAAWCFIASIITTFLNILLIEELIK